jgi:integrase
LPAAKHGLRFHDLRHTAASLLIAAGAHPKAIQERLGHSTIQITMDRYGHLLPSTDLALTEALDATHAASLAPPKVVTLAR